MNIDANLDPRHNGTHGGGEGGGKGDGDDEDEDGDAVDGPTVEAYVNLAKTAGKYHLNMCCPIHNLPTSTACKVYPEDIAAEIGYPELPNLIRQFIYDQQHSDDASDSSISDLPMFYGKITIYPSAVATFHAPSDISGVGGMRCERIRAVRSWRNGPGRYDTIFVNTDSSMAGMRGLDVARARLFFSFSYDGIEYPCALVCWFSRVGDSPDDQTGMWVVRADDDETCPPSIIHLDTVVRAAHLLPVFGPERVSKTLLFTDTLDTFTEFYVNKFVDHHAFEIAS
jgi:hypothetical protein